jgi:hypothetical protein
MAVTADKIIKNFCHWEDLSTLPVELRSPYIVRLTEAEAETVHAGAWNHAFAAMEHGREYLYIFFRRLDPGKIGGQFIVVLVYNKELSQIEIIGMKVEVARDFWKRAQIKDQQLMVTKA